MRAMLIRTAAVALVIGSAPVWGGPDYGFDWATIGDVGNAGYDRADPDNDTTGRGSVDYAYSISKTEVSSGQWLGFLNTFGDYGDVHEAGRDIFASGITRDLSYSGPGRRWMLRAELEAADRVPVLGISWFNAARYANWLHHDKTTDLDKLEYGSYDLRTVTGNVPPPRSEGARFWIPTLDEHLKAAFYDPNKFGEGQGGWWEQPNGSDTELIVGAPSEGGETNAGLTELDVDATSAEVLRLGAYEDVTSPWGLLDLSGGAAEWVDEETGTGFDTDRLTYGSTMIVTRGAYPTFYDPAYRMFTEPAWASGFNSFRIVTTVPALGSMTMLGFVIGIRATRRRR